MKTNRNRKKWFLNKRMRTKKRMTKMTKTMTMSNKTKRILNRTKMNRMNKPVKSHLISTLDSMFIQNVLSIYVK